VEGREGEHGADGEDAPPRLAGEFRRRVKAFEKEECHADDDDYVESAMPARAAPLAGSAGIAVKLAAATESICRFALSIEYV
jgi:hypothetical protein